MKYTTIFFGLLLLCLSPTLSIAQIGDYYLRHYQPDDISISYENRSVVQDAKGRMCFANRKGVLVFDGRHWTLIQTPSSSLTLTYSTQAQKVFVGCRGNFGFIEPNTKGLNHYVSISETLPFFGDVLQVEITGNWVYVLTENYLFEYSIADRQMVSQWAARDYKMFSIFQHQNEIYLTADNRDIYKPIGNELKLQSWRMPNEEHVIFSASVSKYQTLLGTAESQLYIFDGKTSKLIDLEDRSYINEAVPVNAVVSDSLAFIATLRGGVVVINWSTGKTVSFINYNAGLPDNEVQAIGLDEDKGVWVSHEYGISRIDCELPFRAFANYPGLRGNITSLAEINGQLYVGTSMGLFLLHKAKSYQEIKQLVKAQQANNSKQQSSNQSIEVEETENDGYTPDSKPKEEVSDKDGEKKKGWLKRIFSKKNKRKNKDGKEEEIEEDTSSEEKTNTSTPTAETPKSNKNTSKKANGPTDETLADLALYASTSSIYELQSVHWAFRQIKGIRGKCSQLLVQGNQLIVSSNAGIFLVEGEDTQALSNEPIRYLYLSRYTKRLYASTYHDDILSFVNKNGKWVKEESFADMDIYCDYINEDVKGDLWFCGSSYAYRMKLEANGEVADFEPIEINNPYNEQVLLINQKETSYFVISSGIFQYTNGALAIDSARMLEVGFQPYIINRQPDWAWFKDKNTWAYIGLHDLSPATVSYLHLVDDVSGIFVREDQKQIWITTKNNQLYYMPFQGNTRGATIYEAYLRKVRYKNDYFLPTGEFKINQEASGISFAFSMPDYVDHDRISFQYKLVGLDTKWSEWTNDSEISYGTLPSGRYKLLVQVKNSAGKISSTQPVVFYVKPPYWEQAWFYAAEICFFGFLLLLSFRLNRTKMRNKIISRVLTFFTLILIVEFLQVSLESQVTIEKTPVSNFLIQAGIALLLFPFERLLSYFILKKGDDKLLALTNEADTDESKA